MYALNGPIAILLESNCYLNKTFSQGEYILHLHYGLLFKTFFSILADGIFTILIDEISGSHFLLSS